MSAVSTYLGTPAKLRRARRRREAAESVAVPSRMPTVQEAILGYWTFPVSDAFHRVSRANLRILESYEVAGARMPTEVLPGHYLPVLPVLQRFQDFLPIFPWLREEVNSWVAECGIQVYLSPEHPYHLPALESLHDSLLRQGWEWEIDETVCRVREETQSAQILTEVSFRRLMQYTAVNGEYKIGGMRKILGQWVYDPGVAGRLENSKFIITNPPQLRLGQDGYPQIQFSFKSRSDRSTTGMRQRGYVSIIPTDKRAKYEFGQKVKVFCSCPDFKYRWHKVLADVGASHTPTGLAGEASNTEPLITNPNHLPSLCKHLVAVGAYLQKSARDYDRQLRQLRKKPTPRKPKPAVVEPPPEEPEPEMAEPTGSEEGEGSPISTDEEPQGETASSP